jgi:hypothetical protein
LFNVFPFIFHPGPAISQRVKAALDAALIGEDEDEIEFDSPENLPEFNPYLTYGGDEVNFYS